MQAEAGHVQVAVGGDLESPCAAHTSGVGAGDDDDLPGTHALPEGGEQLAQARFLGGVCGQDEDFGEPRVAGHVEQPGGQHSRPMLSITAARPARGG